MSRALVAFLGVCNLLPLIYMVYFFWHIGSARPGVQPDPLPFERLFSLHLAVMALLLVLTVIYIVIAYRSPAVPNDKRTLWTVILFMGNMFAFPVFWYLFLWRFGHHDRKAL